MALDAHSALGAVNGRLQSVVEFRVVLEGLREVGAVEGESSADPAQCLTGVDDEGVGWPAEGHGVFVDKADRAPARVRSRSGEIALEGVEGGGGGEKEHVVGFGQGCRWCVRTVNAMC